MTHAPSTTDNYQPRLLLHPLLCLILRPIQINLYNRQVLLSPSSRMQAQRIGRNPLHVSLGIRECIMHQNDTDNEADANHCRGAKSNDAGKKGVARAEGWFVLRDRRRCVGFR